MEEPQVGKDGRGSHDDDHDTTRTRVMEIPRAAAAGAASASSGIKENAHVADPLDPQSRRSPPKRASKKTA